MARPDFTAAEHAQWKQLSEKSFVRFSFRGRLSTDKGRI